MTIKPRNISWNYFFSEYISVRWKYLINNRAFKKSPIQTSFRAVLWLLHCIFQIPAIVKIDRYNCKFYLEPKLYKTGANSIFIVREYFEPELLYLEKLLSPGKVFVDGGANLGIYSMVAANLVGKSGLVLAFEAAAETFKKLNKNIEINNFKNIKLFNYALSDQEGTARFYHINNAPNSYSLGGETSGSDFEEVNLITLSKVVQDEGIDKIDVIKLDVEGAEELVMRGAKTLFEQMHPTVIFEVSQKATKRLDLDEYGAWNFLQEFGYEFFSFSNTGDLGLRCCLCL